jgi:hypothetical protein
MLRDNFEADQARGSVVGSRTSGEVRRSGIDAERLMCVDHGALRIRSPLRPGWGRHTLAYGPFEARTGAWISTTVLNGHNSSQGGLLGEGLRQRITRWMKGPETEGWPAHVFSWLARGNKRETLWLFKRWLQMRSESRCRDFVELQENLSVGWMPSANGGDPSKTGATFVMRAAEHDNGELCLAAGGLVRSLVHRVTNIPVTYVSIVREDGIAFYAGTTLDGVPALPAAPHVRLLAIVPHEVASGPFFAAIQQAALGQVGFVSATRVYGVRSGADHDIPSFAHCGSICGEGLLGGDEFDGSHASGQRRLPVAGALHKAADGRSSWGPGDTAIRLGEPAGFLRLIMRAVGDGAAELHWRVTEAGDAWAIRLQRNSLSVGRYQSGNWTEIARSPFRASPRVDLQIVDDGDRMRAYGDGNDLFGEWGSRDGSAATGVAIRLEGDGTAVSGFEAFPRSIRLPETMVIPSPKAPGATVARIHERFNGIGQDLDRHPMRCAEGILWRKALGRGTIALTPHGAKVHASPERPLAGRTAYTVPWEHSGAAALEVDVIPPGDSRGQGANGRAGVIFWQDAKNYLIVSTWLDDTYAGASISSFFRVGGHEEIYNAVWTNVGDRVSWGRQYRLHVTFDGDRFVAEVDGEPVLYRALTDVNPKWPALRVRKVGIVANWEWGTDAGSIFSRFQAWSEK